MENLNECSENVEWENKYKQITEVLGEKNIINFMLGIDLCAIFITKALSFNKEILKNKFMNLIIPIVTKIDSINKRVKAKCRELIVNFCKNSIEHKEWIHNIFAKNVI